MKTTIVKGLILGLALTGPAMTLAETGVNVSATVNISSSTTAPKPVKALMEARMEAKGEIKEIRKDLASTTKAIKEDRKEDKKDEVKANIQARIKNRYTKMIERFQATIEREESIMTRINTRISKIKALGGNTVEAEKLTADAKIHIDASKTSLATLKAQADAQATLENSTTTAQTIRNGLDAMRKTAKTIEEHLRAAHKDLQKTVGALRGNSQLHATSTASVKVNN